MEKVFLKEYFLARILRVRWKICASQVCVIVIYWYCACRCPPKEADAKHLVLVAPYITHIARTHTHTYTQMLHIKCRYHLSSNSDTSYIADEDELLWLCGIFPLILPADLVCFLRLPHCRARQRLIAHTHCGLRREAVDACTRVPADLSEWRSETKAIAERNWVDLLRILSIIINNN